MKRILISFILLHFLLSCSNQPKFLIDRSPSSVEEIKKNCINLVKVIFGHAEVEPLEVFNKIDNDEKLNLSERKFLKKYLYLIKSSKDRLFISKKISSNKSLDNHEKSIIRKFVENAALKDQALKKKIYRRRYVAGRSDIPISYGLEIELLLSETPDILKHYRLNSYSEDEWAQLTTEKKLSEALEQVRISDAYSELFTKMPSAHDALPSTLFIEGHKTVEANNIIFNTLGEAQDFLKYFDKSVGRGSVQGHVVYPDKVKLDGAAGFVVFEADYAQLHNLERGYDRLLKNPKTTPANNLIHHALGPLSEDERLLYIVNQDALINQEQFNNIGKAKTVYGVNFRAGKPYEDGYVGFEHRQYHKNYERLVDGMDYQTRELEKKGDLSRYKNFEDAQQIDSSLISDRIDEYQIDLDKDDLELFLISAGEVIEQKSKKMGFTFGGAQPEHRFLFPLKDWINNPILNEMPESVRKEYETKIKEATNDYLKALKRLTEETSIDDIDTEVIRELQILNAKWAHDIQLSSLFHDFRTRIDTEISKTGPPKYYREVIPDFLQELEKKSRYHDKTRQVFKVSSSLETNPQYQHLKENSVELIFSNIGSTGHIYLRVGEKLYSFNYNKSTTVEKFSIPSLNLTNRRGFIYQAPKKTIKNIESYLSSFYKSSEKYNIPPFDAFGKTVEIDLNGDKPKIIRKRKYGSGANNILNGTVFSYGEEQFIRSPNGVQIPIIERNGKKYIKTYSCASSAVHVLKEYFGIDLGLLLAAKTLDEQMYLDKVNVSPDFIFEY